MDKKQTKKLRNVFTNNYVYYTNNNKHYYLTLDKFSLNNLIISFTKFFGGQLTMIISINDKYEKINLTCICKRSKAGREITKEKPLYHSLTYLLLITNNGKE